MTTPDEGADTSVDPAHHALLGLHYTVGTFGEERPGQGTFGPERTGDALEELAATTPDEVSLGARLDVLHALARADFPGYDKHEAAYLALAGSIAEPNGLDPQTVLDDVKASAQGDTPFAESRTATVLPHSDTAFVGEEVCNTARVTIDGKAATWIFSEFETDAPFADLAQWVDPRSWPKRSPMLFKKMEAVGGVITDLAGLEAPEHWHGEFLEEVQLVDRLKTLLHCDYFSDPGTAVGMTYDLTRSLDDQIIVDRGFLLASDIGGGAHRVKALKIVGFEESSWDTVARFVCPLWTDFVRQAATGGTTSQPRDPTEVPKPSGESGGPEPAPIPLPGAEVLDDWVDFFGEAAKTYAHLASDVATRAVSGEYKPADFARDTARYWSQLARDWAQAWAFGLDLVQDVADQGTTLVPAPPQRSKSPESAGVVAGERTDPGTASTVSADTGRDSAIIPFGGLKGDAVLQASDLVCIEAGSVTIGASEIVTAVTTLPGGFPAIRLSTSAANRRPGLYVGTVTVEGGATLPVQLYVSRAVHGSP